MGLLGNIRYMLTQSHYKRTTLCVCVCVKGMYSTECVCMIYCGKQMWLTCLLFVLDNMYFSILYVYI